MRKRRAGLPLSRERGRGAGEEELSNNEKQMRSGEAIGMWNEK